MKGNLKYLNSKRLFGQTPRWFKPPDHHPPQTPRGKGAISAALPPECVRAEAKPPIKRTAVNRSMRNGRYASSIDEPPMRPQRMCRRWAGGRGLEVVAAECDAARVRAGLDGGAGMGARAAGEQVKLL